MKYMTKMLRSEMELQNLDQKELLTAYLYALAMKGKESLSEGELADVVYRAQGILPFKYKFLSKPISYSYELSSDVEKLRDLAHLDAAVEIVGTESIPKYVYSLTSLGKIRAKEIFDILPEEDKKKIETVASVTET